VRPSIHPKIEIYVGSAFVLSGVVLMLLAGGVASAAKVEPDVAKVVIDIASPARGEVVRNRVHVAAIRGSARSGAEDPVDFDVMIAIDLSRSDSTRTRS